MQDSINIVNMVRNGHHFLSSYVLAHARITCQLEPVYFRVASIFKVFVKFFLLARMPPVPPPPARLGVRWLAMILSAISWGHQYIKTYMHI